jgi:hypothetical protein
LHKVRLNYDTVNPPEAHAWIFTKDAGDAFASGIIIYGGKEIWRHSGATVVPRFKTAELFPDNAFLHSRYIHFIDY